MMRFTAALVGALSIQAASGSDVNGTWKYARSLDPLQVMDSPKPPANPYLQIVDNGVWVNENCSGKANKERFNYSEAFQLLLRNGFNEAKLKDFLKGQASFDLGPKAVYFKSDVGSPKCGDDYKRLLVQDDTLLVPVGGVVLRVYRRTGAGQGNSNPPSTIADGHRFSQLPYDTLGFYKLCAANITGQSGKPSATTKCAPVYYPYVADSESKNRLAQLIGSNNYEKRGAQMAQDYAPPFANKLHPVYTVLPLMKDVTVVHVEDLEPQNGEREVMSGVFLSIKDGKVVDQVNATCVMNENYICMAGETRQYQLQPTGKFKHF
ncbi:hypothetical protein ACN9MY_10005 [Pseudoduganella sp. R-31]|uniref:hypothetical protein n=1 Tax=Pseudoduganella sp. R-31 TaxID=3404060 RepID=UPI003CEA0F6F